MCAAEPFKSYFQVQFNFMKNHRGVCAGVLINKHTDLNLTVWIPSCHVVDSGPNLKMNGKIIQAVLMCRLGVLY